MSDMHELVDRYLDETLDADESAELAQWLQADPENARYFAARAELHAGLWRSLRRQAVTPAPIAERREAPPSPRSVPFRAVAALAASLLVAAGLWWIGSRVARQPSVVENPAPVPQVQLAGWNITPTGRADFHLVEPSSVRLTRGELLVESMKNDPAVKTNPLRIETPHGEALATGTRFYVGTHVPNNHKESKMIKPVTRVFVLSGVVTLTTGLGSVKGQAGDLLAAEADKAPTKVVVQANSDFAFDLYQQLAKENEGKNLFFSPYSVSGALAMTAEGARGETAAEMGQVLRFPVAARRTGDDAQRIPWETSLVHTGMSELNRKLNAMDDDPAATAEIRAKIAELGKELEMVKANVAQLKTDQKWQEYRIAVNKEREIAAKLYAESSKVDQYEIRVANALWGEKTYPFDPNYIETINRHYDTGGVFPVDFRVNFEAERLKINGWVEEQTNDRIVDLLPEGSLNDLTRLVLANAIYFKGDWSIPFKEEHTKDRDFTLSTGDKQQTAIMHAPKLGVGRYGAFNADGSHFDTPMRIGRGQDPKGHYPKADGFAIIELPYKGDDLSMLVIAPNDPAGLPAIEQQLAPENLNAWIGQLKQRDTHVYLPKFKMETDYKLGDTDDPGTLQKMGMVRAFIDPRFPKTGAQFKGMTTSTDPMKQLYITKVFHKAFVEVNEKGTEAAAATAVAMAVPRSLPRDFPFTPEFNADRPFVFLIREKSTGSVLFLGRMTQPAE